MSYFDLYVSHPVVFSGCQESFEHADYVVVGVPFDLTSTYRTGARAAPLAIREASLNIETYSFRSNLDIEGLKIHDLGDLHISNNVEVTLERLVNTVKDLLKAKKKPILIGGEHTITLGAVCGLGGKDTSIISFDAHLDLRNKYMDFDVCHTTFMRRLNEQAKPKKIIEVGTRAVCKEELAYAKKAGIQYFTMEQIRKLGLKTASKAIRKSVENCGRTYLTIDMDVLDPSFAPAVQNPEPEGLSTSDLLDLVLDLCDGRTIGLDIVEVAPLYDNGITAILAARILFEALCRIEKAQNS
ncbi:MAG: agmatinase [Candidatus Bathyarchaeota archaeon]|nr:MAG: agmatinase [Candidatus Bathyarchaeota archaeon]